MINSKKNAEGQYDQKPTKNILEILPLDSELNEISQNDIYSHHGLISIIFCNKWSLLILTQLSVDTCRFGELRKKIPGISRKMLAKTLKLLTNHHLVSRDEYSTRPLRVDYKLTSLGSELSKILKLVIDWVKENSDKLKHFPANSQSSLDQ